MSGWSHRMAALLTASGFLVYPHSYSRGGNAWNAGAVVDVELTRVLEAPDALKSFEACDGKMALYGVSRGAEHALPAACLAAREGVGPSIDAVACLTAPDVICGAFDAKSFRDAGDPGWRAWGPARRAWTWQGRSDALLPSTPIPVEAYGGSLFLAAGGKDQTWSPEMTRRIETRRIAAALPVEMHCEPDEGHMLRSDVENRHHARLLVFLGRHLAKT